MSMFEVEPDQDVYVTVHDEGHDLPGGCQGDPGPTYDEEVEPPRVTQAALDAPFDKVAAQEEAMRAFGTGATRNVEKDPDIHGFTSPLALAMFARYMHTNRTQADGTIRDSDNWKKGIPLDSYVRSMRRHLQDLTLHHDGYGDCAREDIYAALSGLFFNVQGYMHELAKADIEAEREQEDKLMAFVAAVASLEQQVKGLA